MSARSSHGILRLKGVGLSAWPLPLSPTDDEEAEEEEDDDDEEEEKRDSAREKKKKPHKESKSADGRKEECQRPALGCRPVRCLP